LLAAAAAVLCTGGLTAASAAQRPAGTVLAWGKNSDSELGNGSTARSSVPVQVHLPPGTQVTAVSADAGHGLALTSGGRVLAWGYNNFGELGDGTTTDRSVPVEVPLPAFARFVAVSAGGGHSLALASDGSVFAWGYNGDGELGYGSTVITSTPVDVILPAGSRVIAVSAGGNHSLALTSGGQVLAWGSNGFGQLGDGRPRSSATFVEVDLPAGDFVTAVSAGGAHSLALTSGGRVLAWGADSDGQLGDGGTTNSSVPVPVHLPAGIRVIAVSAGTDYSLALTSDGRVLAWGADFVGQLGDGGTTDSSVPALVHLPAGARVIAVSAGGSYSLALTSGGEVLAWGYNGDGELGNGTTKGSPVPVEVRLPAFTRADRVVAVSAGAADGLALTARASAPRRLPWLPVTG
jgi:alpha-tubulin suppressor-like RCC1 family protein